MDYLSTCIGAVEIRGGSFRLNHPMELSSRTDCLPRIAGKSTGVLTGLISRLCRVRLPGPLSAFPPSRCAGFWIGPARLFCEVMQ